MVQLVGFYYKNISRCTVLWMSNSSMPNEQNKHINIIKINLRNSASSWLSLRINCTSSWYCFTRNSLLYSDKHRACFLVFSKYLTNLNYRQVKSYTDFTVYVGHRTAHYDKRRHDKHNWNIIFLTIPRLYAQRYLCSDSKRKKKKKHEHQNSQWISTNSWWK